MEIETLLSRLGDSIQDYDLEKKIGGGQFGEVFEAICKNSGNYVAIKMMKKHGKLSKHIREEINVHRMLQHEKILQFYKSFADDNYIYLVLELCNTDLQKYTQSKSEKCLNEIEARIFFAQILKGMLYLKKNNVLHRDLKLANILLKRKNQNEVWEAKIGDFGLATIRKNSSTFCGTPAYMSPRLFSGKVHTFESELYSLGIILYTMLVGKTPSGYQKDEAFIKSLEFDLPKKLSRDCIDLIKRCMKVDPKKIICLEEIQQHPFLLNTKETRHMPDSGLHTESISGYQSDRRQINSNPGSNNYRSYSPPVYMKSNPNDLPVSYYRSKYCLNGEFPPPLIQQRSVRMNGGSTDYSRSYGFPLKPIHPEKENIPYIPNLQNSDVLNEPSHYQINSKTDNFHDQYYSNQRNIPYHNEECHELRSHLQSSCSGSPLQSYSERNKNTGHHLVSECNSGIQNYINPKQNSLSQNCPSRIITNCHNSQNIINSNSLQCKPLQLSSTRLKEVRQLMPQSVLSILRNSQVCIEYLKKNDTKKIIEILKVSQDGNKILVYRPNGKKGVDIADCPPKEGGDISDHTYDSLPQKYWRRYADAYKFAENAKAKTPKITINGEPKAYLMENGDVVAEYKNGYKCVFDSRHDPWKGKLKGRVILTKGSRIYTYNEDACSFDGNDYRRYEECFKKREQLIGIEKSLTILQVTFPHHYYFPVYFGQLQTISTKSAKDSQMYRYSKKENMPSNKSGKVSRPNRI